MISLNYGRISKKNGAVDYRSKTAISLADCRMIAPSIFAEQKHESRSERYSYIPTSEILTGLAKEGFQPFAIMQAGTGDEVKRGFTKHLVRLKHANSVVSAAGTENEIVLINSHDGSSSYRLMSGVFRMVCSNGLITAETLIQDQRVKHSGNIRDLVIEGCVKLLSDMPIVTNAINELKAINLSSSEAKAFATAALALKYDEEIESPVTPEKILLTRRSADLAPDIFTTFNVIQENLVKGGQRTYDKTAGRVRTTRPVKSIEGNTSLNRALWTLAEEMRKIKTA